MTNSPVTLIVLALGGILIYSGVRNVHPFDLLKSAIGNNVASVNSTIAPSNVSSTQLATGTISSTGGGITVSKAM